MPSSTRFGFTRGGVGDGGDDPPGADPQRGSATVYGREIHLGARSIVEAPPLLAGTPVVVGAMPAAAPMAPAIAGPRPRSGRGKSGFPAHAGIWGRRNTEGELVPLTEPALRDSLFFIPTRHPIVRHLLVVLSAATLSFMGVLGVMKLREPRFPVVAPAPARSLLAPVAPTGAVAPAPPATAPAPLPVAPVPAPSAAPPVLVHPAVVPAVAPARAHPGAAQRPLRQRSVPARKARPRRPITLYDPDSPLPPSFF